MAPLLFKESDLLVDKKDVPARFKKAALDSDLIVYRSAFSAQHTYWHLYNGEEHIGRFPNAKAADEYVAEQKDFLGVDTSGYRREPEIIVDTEQAALDACDLIIKNIHKNVVADEYKYYLTDSKGNYREQIATTLPYKGERDKVAKPVYYQQVKQHIQDKWGAYITLGCEADDACSVIGYRGFTSKAFDTCIVTADKDLLGCPGYLYNFTKDEWHFTDELEADRFFFSQCLHGDLQVDNILGLENLGEDFRLKHKIRKSKGVGKKTSEKLLAGCENREEMFGVVREAYQSFHGEGWRDVLNEMGKLLWMQRRKGVVWDVSWYE